MPWQLETPVSAIIFDCDGTLSSIEGVDELARHNGVYHQVQTLTAAAMGSIGINPALYEQRLELIRPTQEQVHALGQEYFIHQTVDAHAIIQLLQRLKKTIYIVSAGVYPAVLKFGQLLQVPAENIFAVKVFFDTQKKYLDYDHHSPLIHNQGKQEIVAQIKLKHPKLIYIGDGLNDLSVYDLVTRFVGYGGAYYRENIAERCQYYIQMPTMAPLLPLVLTRQEQKKLLLPEQAIYQRGLEAIKRGEVKGAR
ncbi:MAG TPA: HAD-IB family phosphatase [Gammaproteobacteria bacterium]|jgi:phosphoserine phosphatase|nr:HAD-IB family phosphatase [Gammaproteobacteria bacterium]